MNVDIDARDNHPFVAIMAFPNPPEADPFLISKNFSEIRHCFFEGEI